MESIKRVFILFACVLLSWFCLSITIPVVSGNHMGAAFASRKSDDDDHKDRKKDKKQNKGRDKEKEQRRNKEDEGGDSRYEDSGKRYDKDRVKEKDEDEDRDDDSDDNDDDRDRDETRNRDRDREKDEREDRDDDDDDNDDDNGDDDDDDHKVTICHVPPGNPAAAHTIRVGRAATATHLAHGDYLGECKAPDDENNPPIADAGGPYQIDLGDGVTLDGSGSSDADVGAGDSIVSYRWDINNDSIFGDVTGVNPSIRAIDLAGFGLNRAGSFPIALQVEDESGATDVDTTVIEVFPNVPVAVAKATPTTVAPGEAVTFDHSASSHQSIGHQIVLYVWDFEDDGTFDFSTADRATKPEHSYSFIPGVLTRTEIAALRVVDDNSPAKTDRATVEITVTFANTEPIANAGGPYSVNLGNGVTLDGSASSDPNEDVGDSIVDYQWDINNDGIFGDVNGAMPTLTAGALAAFGIDAVGNFPISLKVIDTFGASDVDTTHIAVVDVVPGALRLGGLSLNTRHYRDFVDRIISLMVAETGVGQLIGGEQLMALIRSNPELQADLIGFIKNVVPQGIFPEQLILRPDLPLVFDQAANIELENFGNGITPSPITDLLPGLGVPDAGLPRLLNGDKLDLYLVVTHPDVPRAQFTLSGPATQTIEGERVDGPFPHTFHLEEEQAILFLPSWPGLNDAMPEVFSAVTLKYATNDLPQPDIFGNVPVAPPAPADASAYTGQAALQPRLIDNKVVWTTTVDVQPGKIYYYFYEVELVRPVTIELPGFPPDYTVSRWVMPDPRNLQIEDRGIIARLITAEFQAAMAQILDPIVAAIAAGGPFPDITVTPEQQQALLNIVLPEAQTIFDEIVATMDPRLASLFTVPRIDDLQSLWTGTFDLGANPDGEYQLSASVFGGGGTLINQISGKTVTVDRTAPEAEVVIGVNENAGLYRRQSDGVYVATALPPAPGETDLPKSTLRITAIPQGDQSDLAGYLYQMIQHEADASQQILHPWMPLRVDSTGLGEGFADFLGDILPNQLSFLADLLDIAPVTFSPPHQLDLLLRGENNQPGPILGEFGVRVVGVDGILNINSNIAPMLRLDIVPPAADTAQITFVVVGDVNGDGDMDDALERGTPEEVMIFSNTTDVQLTVEITSRTVHPLASIDVQFRPVGENLPWQKIGTLNAHDLADAEAGSTYDVNWNIDDVGPLVAAGDHVRVRAVATNALSISDASPVVTPIRITSEAAVVDAVRIPVSVPLQSWLGDCGVITFAFAQEGSIVHIVEAILPYPHDRHQLSINMPAGVYDISAKQHHRLSRVIRNVVVAPDMALVEFPPLLAGDVDNDNQIEFVSDFLAATAKVGNSHDQACDFIPSDETVTAWHADINGDGIVDVEGDIRPLLDNLDKVGDEILPTTAASRISPETAMHRQGHVVVSSPGPNSRLANELWVPLSAETFEIQLLAKEMTSIYGYTLDVKYGSGLALSGGVEGAIQEGDLFQAQRPTSALFFTQHDTQQHQIRLIGALTGEPSSGSKDGEIARIRFQRLSEQPSFIEVSQMKLVDAHGQYHVLKRQVLPVRVVPNETRALTNYPNPFNPETWVPYHLAEGTDVQLEIYTAQGQLVRRIEVGYRQPGVYTHRGDAIYWDGRNSYGEVVSSGLYFYQLRAGTLTQIRRMLLLK